MLQLNVTFGKHLICTGQNWLTCFASFCQEGNTSFGIFPDNIGHQSCWDKSDLSDSDRE